MTEIHFHRANLAILECAVGVIDNAERENGEYLSNILSHIYILLQSFTLRYICEIYAFISSPPANYGLNRREIWTL